MEFLIKVDFVTSETILMIDGEESKFRDFSLSCKDGKLNLQLGSEVNLIKTLEKKLNSKEKEHDS